MGCKMVNYEICLRLARLFAVAVGTFLLLTPAA